MSVEEKINNMKYIPDFLLSDNQCNYWNIAKDLENSFKIDLFAEFGIIDNDKAIKLFDILKKTALNPYTNSYYKSMYQMFANIWVLMR